MSILEVNEELQFTPVNPTLNKHGSPEELRPILSIRYIK
jgi:hypothetical protein